MRNHLTKAVALLLVFFSPLAGGLLSQATAVAQPSALPDTISIDTSPQRSRVSSSTASEPTITFFYGKRQFFCQIGVPQRWVNILGNVTDPDGIGSLTYSLNGGGAVTLNIGPDTRRLALDGDFNVDLPLAQLNPSGDSNIVVVTATDLLSNIRNDTVVVWVYPGTTWPMPATVSWDWYAAINDAAQVVDGSWTLAGNSIRTGDVGYDRLVAVGDTTWTDYEVTVPVTIHSIDPAGYNPTSGQPAVGIFMRWSGHTDSPVSGWQPKSGWNPSGALGMYAFNADGGERLEIWQHGVDLSGKTVPLGQTHMFKMRVENQTGGHHYALRVWKQTDPEPAEWDLMYLDVDRRAARGSLLLVAHHVDATFGEVSVGLPGPLPVQLVTFAGTALNSSTVQLSWRTLSETGNYGFEVEKAPDAPEGFTTVQGSFVPGHGTTIEPHDYAYTDTGAVGGVWYYRLRQIDLDGTIAYSDPVQVNVGTVTSVFATQMPEVFALEQNFPNPFNPTTTIVYTIGSEGHGTSSGEGNPGSALVKLTLYDVLGREVATLVNEMKSPGRYQATFDAAGLASGVYLYRLEAGGSVQVRQMVVMR